MILDVRFDDSAMVGRLADDPSGRIFFQYDATWLQRGRELSPLHLPLSLGRTVVGHHERYAFQGLFGLFADSLPLGWGRKLLDRRLSELGLHPRQVGSLVRLGFLGDRGMGALTFRPDQDPESGAIREAIALAQIDAEAQRLAAGESAVEAESLQALLAAGTSPGGARPKVLVAVQGESLRLTAGLSEGWEPWIVKLTEGAQAEAGRIEFAYAAMARAAGLEVPPTRLFEGRYFGVQRFDRANGRRRHVHTLGGMLQAADGSYEDLARTALELTRDHRSLEDVFLRAAFNVGAFVRDDHLLNVAFQQSDDGTWTLAPCYDLTPNDLSRIPPGHAMSVRGRANPAAGDLLAFAEEFSLENGRDLLDRVRATLADWPGFARTAGVDPAAARAIADLLREGDGFLRPPLQMPKPRRRSRVPSPPASSTPGEG
ncbi:MAG: type II toxin-antitoxin system HipA family toxin [Verrucomicrobia bacterium]|nr:type II toxin-antitoxin system HipA family toxin [Verrucomicrobiota bacterium]